MKILILLRFLMIVAAIIAAGLVASGPQHQTLGQKWHSAPTLQLPATAANTLSESP